MGLPHPDPAALAAYRDIAQELSQWAPTVHQLVRTRVAALADAYGLFDSSTESLEEFAQRVLAGGQYPFPQGVSVYDDLNSNRTYEHVEVGYGQHADGGTTVTFTGRYPDIGQGSRVPTWSTARVYCPGWLISAPDGVDRFHAQTAEMVTKVTDERAARDADIEKLVSQLSSKTR